MLMNDLDFSAETTFYIANFYCRFDGGNNKLLNVPTSGTGLKVFENSSIVNIEVIYTDAIVYGGLATSFLSAYSTTISNITLSNVIVRNDIVRQDRGMQLFNANIIIDASCLIEDITIEGLFTALFYEVQGAIARVRVLNRNSNEQALFYNIGGGAIVQDIRLIKPLTFSPSLYNGLVSNTIFDGATIRRVSVWLGIIQAPAFYGIGGKFSAYSGTYVYEDILIEWEKASTDNSAGGYAASNSNLYGSATNPLRRIIFNGDIYTPNHARTSIITVTSRIEDSYYNKDILQSIADVNSQGQVGLTTLQMSDAENFVGWDFVNTWIMGAAGPSLRYAENDSAFVTTRSSCILSTERIGSYEFRVNKIVSIGTTEEIEVLSPDLVIIYDQPLSEGGNTITLTSEKDSDYIVRAYVVENGVKHYTFETTYAHLFHDSAVDVQDVICDEYIPIDGVSVGSYVHGTALRQGTLYGSTRNTPATGFLYDGGIIKANVDSLSAYTHINVVFEDGSKSGDMDSVVIIGGNLYATISKTAPLNSYILQYNLATDDYKIYRHFKSNFPANGGPSCTDGLFWYVYVGDNLVLKIDVASLNSEFKFNEAEPWAISYASYSCTLQATAYDIKPHTMVVDNSHLYLGFGTGSSKYEYEIHKVSKHTMEFESFATVPKMTDDMCQTDNHLFIGLELHRPSNNTSYGYGWGVCAIRKADMRVTALPKLHLSDGVTITSYASLIFGNYLLDLKTNRFIYAIDISDPDTWGLEENIGSRTLKTYRVNKIEGVLIPQPVNEIHLADNGLFVGFAWGVISSIVSFDLPGLNYFAAPTIITDDATIVDDNDVSLQGYITSTGGKTVTAVGVILGHAADLSDGVDYPVTPVTTEFEKAFNDLEYGTYYFRAYATNAEGTGYGEIKSFTLEIPYTEPTVTTIDAAVVGDNDVSLSGYVSNTGGKAVTAVGVTLGQAVDLSDGVDYPVTPVTTEFEKVFNDLEYGTYYFRTYATNAEGTGYGEIKSFTLEIPYTEPGQPTALDKSIQAEITISWTAPIDDGGTPVTGYKIERKASDGDWAVIVANTGSTATTYTETLPQGVYQYRVSAITAYTTGQPSAILDVNAVVGGGGMYRIYLGSTEIATIG